MRPNRPYDTVHLTEAGAARWPELGLPAGIALMLLDPPGEYGQAAQIPFHPLHLLLADGDFTPADPLAPAASRPPRVAAPPVHPAEEVTACAPPTGSDPQAPLTPAGPGWPGLTGLDDDEIHAAALGTLGTIAVVVAALIVAWAVTR